MSLLGMPDEALVSPGAWAIFCPGGHHHGKISVLVEVGQAFRICSIESEFTPAWPSIFRFFTPGARGTSH